MNRAKSMCMALVVLLAGAGMGQEAPKQRVRSTCLVKVPQDNEKMVIIGSLAGTADVAGKAAQEVLGLSVAPDVSSRMVSLGVVELYTQLPQDTLTKASAFWRAVSDNLRKGMEQVHDQEIKRIRGQVELAERQKAEALAKLQGKGPAEGGLSEGQLAAKRQELLGGQEAVGMDLAVFKARRQAIEQQIAELNKRIDERIGADLLLKDLQQLVEALTKDQNQIRKMVETGRVPASDVTGALERLVKTKLELARQKEATAQSAGGELLTKFSSELSEMSIRSAELEARLVITRDQLGKVDAQLAQARASFPQTIERELAMRSLKQSEERLYDLRQGLANLQPPTVTIIGAGD